MLEGLDRVDWASLRHAYGAATDVPGLLRSLLSADPKVREQAIYELFGNIWHQGTIYPASAAAVPFLYELLTAPGVQDKSNIAHLLASIADGVGYLEVHAVGDFGEPTWRKILGERGKTLEGELEREAAEISAVRRAASARAYGTCCRTSAIASPRFGGRSQPPCATTRNMRIGRCQRSRPRWRRRRTKRFVRR
jgi:hypothetical protein